MTTEETLTQLLQHGGVDLRDDCGEITATHIIFHSGGRTTTEMKSSSLNDALSKLLSNYVGTQEAFNR